MNAPKATHGSEAGAISSEALIGLGITISALGLLGLLLGWAQHMRSVPDNNAAFWFVLGSACVILGGIIASAARARKSRQP